MTYWGAYSSPNLSSQQSSPGWMLEPNKSFLIDKKKKTYATLLFILQLETQVTD